MLLALTLLTRLSVAEVPADAVDTAPFRAPVTVVPPKLLPYTVPWVTGALLGAGGSVAVTIVVFTNLNCVNCFHLDPGFGALITLAAHLVVHLVALGVTGVMAAIVTGINERRKVEFEAGLQRR